ncbi:multiple C2 and transmembrane domain-containing protein 2 [Esox lucius]|uniref:C2 domain-containing protein n=1 Tax=Esox lucius TaxID=8010 RepID=A0A3P8YNB3_ESOLU|nr:multiple C2 and transmembrane domain-containing protein 2 [Esox lucius]
MDPKKRTVWENLREKIQLKNTKKKTPGKKKPKPLQYRRSISVPDLRLENSEPSPADSAFTASDAFSFCSSSGSSDNTSVTSVPLFTDRLTATDTGPSGRKNVHDVAFTDNRNTSCLPMETHILYEESEEEEDMATFVGRIHMSSDKWNTPMERSTSSASSSSVDKVKTAMDRGNPPVTATRPAVRSASSVSDQTNLVTERLAASREHGKRPSGERSNLMARLNIPSDRWSLPVDKTDRITSSDRIGTPVDCVDGSVCETPVDEQAYPFWPNYSEDLNMREPPLSTDIRDIFCREPLEDIELTNEQNDQPLQDQAGNNVMAAGAPLFHIHKYLLTINLKEGRNLVIRNRNGKSDSYVKFKLEGKTVYKSKVVYKNLNPKWSESFSHPLQDREQVFDVRVYDKNLTTDDFMGSSTIVIKDLELDRTSEMVLKLEDPNSAEDDMGVIVIDTCLTYRDATIKRPKWHQKKRGGQNQKGDQNHDKAQNQRSAEATNCQLWSGVFGITLVEGQDMPEYGHGDIYVRCRLGDQKYKSKNLCVQANPQWKERFDFNKYEEGLELLQVEVFSKRGRKSEESWGMVEVDLSRLPADTQQLYTRVLNPDKGLLVFLVTLKPCQGVTVNDINKAPLEQSDERDQILEQYSLKHSLKCLREVGFIQVKVFRATDLTSTDRNGKSDPFCVLELGNSRLQTQTIYKTLNPEWNKVFTLPIKDIHDVLELTVFGEAGDKSPDFLGRVAIPLLTVQNGQQVTGMLKKANLEGLSKGTISLEMEVHYNPVRAGIRTFLPKEEKLQEENKKFAKKVLAQNIYRVRKITMALLHTLQYIKSCFQWESTKRSIIAFLIFMVTVWTWELFMLPLFLLLLIGWNYFQITVGKITCNQDLVNMNMADEEEEDEKEKKGLMEKIYMVQEIVVIVQKILDEIACLGERVKNTFNWSVPFLSCLACLVLFVATVALYYIPLRYIILIWGVNKFTKKLRNPYAIDNNEILDFLKRVPSDVQKVQYSELRVPSAQSPPRRRR